MPMQSFIRVKVNFERKILFFPLRNVCFLYYAEIWYRYGTLLSIFRPIICRVVTYKRLKTKESFKLLALKVGTVA